MSEHATDTLEEQDRAERRVLNHQLEEIQDRIRQLDVDLDDVIVSVDDGEPLERRS